VIVFPGQSILVARRADYALRVLVHTVLVLFRERIFMLRLYETPAYLDGVKLIAADTPVEYFLAAGLSVKVPPAGCLDDGHRKRPSVGAYGEKRASMGLGIHRNAFLLTRLRGKRRSPLLVANAFAGLNDVASVRAEYLLQLGDVILFGRGNQRIRRFL